MSFGSRLPSSRAVATRGASGTQTSNEPGGKLRIFCSLCSRVAPAPKQKSRARRTSLTNCERSRARTRAGPEANQLRLAARLAGLAKHSSATNYLERWPIITCRLWLAPASCPRRRRCRDSSEILGRDMRAGQPADSSIHLARRGQIGGTPSGLRITQQAGSPAQTNKANLSTWLGAQKARSAAAAAVRRTDSN